ncbi:MAG: hypothetical protein RL885_27865 [Planctomycetota bacterium]
MLRVIQFVFFCLTWPLAPILTILFSIKEILRAAPQILEATLSISWLGILLALNVVQRVLWTLGLGSREKVHFTTQQAKHFYREARSDLLALRQLGRTVLARFFRIMGLGRAFLRLERKIERSQPLPIPDAPPASPPSSEHRYEFEKYYQIQRRLAPGGSTAQLFVVKKLEKGEAVGEDQVLKYFDLTQGSHLENIVRESGSVQLATKLGLVLDSRMSKTAFYYVMPYYHGSTLTQEVYRTYRPRPDGWTPSDDIYRRHLVWTRQLLEVIVAFHHRGVFHKDIKPDNLIVSGEHLYLIDIGLLTPLSSTLQLTTHGTEYFRDPEIVRLAARGVSIRDIDCAKFDIYSIGAVLFFMLEGAFPASGSLSRSNRSTPFCLQWVCNRAMTDFEKRYRSANQMLRDVEDLLDLSERMSFAEIKVSSLSSFGDDGPRFATGPAERIPRPLPTQLRSPAPPPPSPHTAAAYVQAGPSAEVAPKEPRGRTGRIARTVVRAAVILGFTGAGVFAIEQFSQGRFERLEIAAGPQPSYRSSASRQGGRVIRVRPGQHQGVQTIPGTAQTPGELAPGVEIVQGPSAAPVPAPQAWNIFEGMTPVEKRLDREQLLFRTIEDLQDEQERLVALGAPAIEHVILVSLEIAPENALSEGLGRDLFQALVTRGLTVERAQAAVAEQFEGLIRAAQESPGAFQKKLDGIRSEFRSAGASLRPDTALLAYLVDPSSKSPDGQAELADLHLILQYGQGLGVRSYSFRNASSSWDR